MRKKLVRILCGGDAVAEAKKQLFEIWMRFLHLFLRGPCFRCDVIVVGAGQEACHLFWRGQP